ncbi:putative fungal-specific transcription factor [Lophiostoma macrostomum CBS 122681]|uniref:Putative fungal-specific transcription factor n=1 Tax=Lophiostoma macrostomum CBS 122681 TaxID=1314788 RepID=A0A6A6SQK1_9PLEO|nr:putative fungal-specific transcription factor [Lophiostoma macrostomum CBS 122681]
MESPISESSRGQAKQVCISCKVRKRKCDKILPACSYCTKRRWKCNYPTVERADSPDSTTASAWADVLDPTHARTPLSLDLATVTFLDPTLLEGGQIDFSQPATYVPAHTLALLGDIETIHETAAVFFRHTHTWMPFISKKRFYEIHLRTSFHTRSDVVLLLLSLKLLTSLPPTNPRNPRTSLYLAVKQFHLQVETSNAFSILVLQAGILIALYEVGHGIYPAAFLSVGACARYAHALGIKISGQSAAKRVLSLVEVEEKRRVWWAIVILERFVSIGCPGRPLVTVEPTLDDLLPCSDAAWDQGIVRVEDNFRLSSPMSSHMSKFALLCQAARLLGQVLTFLSSDPTAEDTTWVQLDRTLQSILAAALDLQSPDYDQITFIYSSLLALHTPGLENELDQNNSTERTQRARAVIDNTTDRIWSNLIERQCFLGRDREDLSPWGLFFAYRICNIHMHARPDDASARTMVDSLKTGLVFIDSRWNLAGAYLQLIEAQEVMMMR